MSCPPENTLDLKAGYINSLPLTLDDGATPTDLTGATIRLVARESSAEDPLIDIAVTDHTDPAAGESAIEIDLTEVSEEILETGVRLNAEIIVLGSDDVLVFDQFFTIQIRPQLGA